MFGTVNHGAVASSSPCFSLFFTSRFEGNFIDIYANFESFPTALVTLIRFASNRLFSFISFLLIGQNLVWWRAVEWFDARCHGPAAVLRFEPQHLQHPLPANLLWQSFAGAWRL